MPISEQTNLAAKRFSAFHTPAYNIIVIGGSAGGIEALIEILALLPHDFCLPIVAVQHLSPNRKSALPDIVGRRTPLKVKWAEHDEALRPATVYIAPADQHLRVLRTHRLQLSAEAPVGHWRPAVDVLFFSAADVYAEGVIAIVLSGYMWDGARGINAVGHGGGITIAQDEFSSQCFDMPSAAIDIGRADLAMNPARIAATLCLLGEPPRKRQISSR